MGTIIVIGVPGVGKTTVVTRASELAGVPVAVYGSEMFEQAKARGLVEDRDEMRKLPAKTQKEIQERAAENIATRGRVVVDTHGFIQTPVGFLPGLPEWVARRLDPSVIVLVESDPIEISSRRADDATRVRDEDSADNIAMHQEMNRNAASAVAFLSGATVAIIENRQGEAETAAKQLARLLE